MKRDPREPGGMIAGVLPPLGKALRRGDGGYGNKGGGGGETARGDHDDLDVRSVDRGLSTLPGRSDANTNALPGVGSCR